MRKLQFIGSGLDDNLLLWDLLFEMIRRGWTIFQNSLEEEFQRSGLYGGCDVCYGSTYELAKVLLFHTVGMIGDFAVRSGALTIPKADCPLGGFLYQAP